MIRPNKNLVEEEPMVGNSSDSENDVEQNVVPRNQSAPSIQDHHPLSGSRNGTGYRKRENETEDDQPKPKKSKSLPLFNINKEEQMKALEEKQRNAIQDGDVVEDKQDLKKSFTNMANEITSLSKEVANLKDENDQLRLSQKNQDYQLSKAKEMMVHMKLTIQQQQEEIQRLQSLVADKKSSGSECQQTAEEDSGEQSVSQITGTEDGGMSDSNDHSEEETSMSHDGEDEDGEHEDDHPAALLESFDKLPQLHCGPFSPHVPTDQAYI